jgi:hypothetical protein
MLLICSCLGRDGGYRNNDRYGSDRQGDRRDDRSSGSGFGSSSSSSSRSGSFGGSSGSGFRRDRFNDGQSRGSNDRYSSRRNDDSSDRNNDRNRDNFGDRRSTNDRFGGRQEGREGREGREADNDYRRRELERQRPVRSADAPLSAREIDDVPPTVTASTTSSKAFRDNDNDDNTPSSNAFGGDRRARGNDSFRRGDHGRYGARREERPRYDNDGNTRRWDNNDRRSGSGSYGRDRFDRNNNDNDRFGNRDRRRDFGSRDGFQRNTNDRFERRRSDDDRTSTTTSSSPSSSSPSIGSRDYKGEREAASVSRGEEQRSVRRQLAEASASLDDNKSNDNKTDDVDDDAAAAAEDASGTDVDAIDEAADTQHELVYGSHSGMTNRSYCRVR